MHQHSYSHSNAEWTPATVFNFFQLYSQIQPWHSYWTVPCRGSMTGGYIDPSRTKQGYRKHYFWVYRTRNPNRRWFRITLVLFLATPNKINKIAKCATAMVLRWCIDVFPLFFSSFPTIPHPVSDADPRWSNHAAAMEHHWDSIDHHLQLLMPQFGRQLRGSLLGHGCEKQNQRTTTGKRKAKVFPRQNVNFWQSSPEKKKCVLSWSGVLLDFIPCCLMDQTWSNSAHEARSGRQMMW